MKVRDLKPGIPFTIEGSGSLSGSKTTYIKLDDLGSSGRDNALIIKSFVTTRISDDQCVTWSSPVPIESD